MWKSIGGLARCQEVNQEIASFVDVMIGNEEDFTVCLGFKVEGADENLAHIEIDSFKRMIEQAVAKYPEFPGDGDNAAGRQERYHQRLGRGSLARGTIFANRVRTPAWRSWTASEAATVSPRG